MSGDILREAGLNFACEYNSMRSTVGKYFKYAHNENLAMMPEQIKAHELSVLLSSPTCKVESFQET